MEGLQRLKELRKAVFKVKISGVITSKTLNKLNKDLKKETWRQPVALALVVNSPGGSAAQSSLLRQRLMAYSTQHKVPIYTFAEDIAASGGYYVMLAGEELYVSQPSLVGSIGARLNFVGLKDLAAKYGIERRSWSTSPLALEERLDPLRDLSSEAEKWVKSMLEQTHNEFKEVVEESRGEKLRGKTEELFSGDVFTAERALEMGLVDKLGECDQVMKEMFPEYKIVELSKESWLSQMRSKYIGS
mmetsp:Transcript_9649/g.14374  ORF Transcript_9649/g.14374 Transcript_9649/m.14374 type:complete len:245 (+) Transcript_9649:6-740(+)